MSLARSCVVDIVTPLDHPAPSGLFTLALDELYVSTKDNGNCPAGISKADKLSVKLPVAQSIGSPAHGPQDAFSLCEPPPLQSALVNTPSATLGPPIGTHWCDSLPAVHTESPVSTSDLSMYVLVAPAAENVTLRDVNGIEPQENPEASEVSKFPGLVSTRISAFLAGTTCAPHRSYEADAMATETSVSVTSEFDELANISAAESICV